MNLAFERPELLLAIPAMWAVLWLATRLGPRRERARWRRHVSLAVRGLLLALLSVALAGPYRTFRTEEHLEDAWLPDGSGSISERGAIQAGFAAGEFSRDRRPPTILPFGSARDSDARPALLRAAVADVGRLGLATDGHLDGDPSPLVADLVRAGRGVGIAALTDESTEKPLATPGVPEIRLPPAAREGVPATVEVDAPGAERITLLVDGTTVAVAEGSDAVFPDLRLKAGEHLVTASAETEGRREIASRTMDVAGPVRVLVLGGGSIFSNALEAQDVAVRSIAGGAPGPADLEGVRVVITLPGYDPPPDDPALVDFVAGGGGLLAATGAPPGLARLADHALAALLPANAKPPAPEPAPPDPEPPEPPPEPEEPDEGASPAEVEKDAVTVTVVLVMDRSGSMRGEKIGLARAACYATATTLDPADRLGVLGFNDQVGWVHPIASAGNLEQIKAALLAMKAEGGTEIYLALREAYDRIREEPAAVRHVILVSDGQDLIQGFKQLVDRMRSESITVTTVGIGWDHEPGLLGNIAKWGAGRFYPSADPRRLPAIVTQDTRRVLDAARPVETKPSPDITAGPQLPEPPEPAAEPEPERPPEPPPDLRVAVRAANGVPFLDGLAFPDLREVEPAEPRFPAQVALATEEGDPILLFWRYGRGRVALLLADPGSWEDWPDFPRFASQTVRMLAGARPDWAAGPTARVDGDRLLVTSGGEAPRARLVTPDGDRALALTPTGPGSYSARLPEAAPGTLRDLRVTGPAGAETRVLALAPRLRESDVHGMDQAQLDALARAAGKPLGAVPAAPPPRRTPGRDPVHLVLLFAALALLPVDVAVRRVGA